MSKHAVALAFINKLIEKYIDGVYIFRGTAECYSIKSKNGKNYDGINSTLYRGSISIERDKKLRKKIPSSQIPSLAKIEEAKVNAARKHFPSNTENHEILTELQHFGGKTNLIDFSRSIYIALFFACQGKPKESGEIIALRQSNLTPIDKIDYSMPPPKKGLQVINPAGTQGSRQRVHFQSSVFVRPPKGYINLKDCKKFRICGKLKEPLREYLEELHNITVDTIYNDLHGFIKNEANDDAASEYFYAGLEIEKKGERQNAVAHHSMSIKRQAQKEPVPPVEHNILGNFYAGMKKYEIAIKNYDEAISLNPDFAKAYSNRGSAYGSLGQHERAIQDFDKAISINPDLALTYSNRGVSYNDLRQYERAIRDFEKAISINPNLVAAYVNRGSTYIYLEQYQAAIKDFDKAISINPNFVVAYVNRGSAYKNLGQYQLAIKDFDQAISLNPDLAEAYSHRGNIYSNLGQYQLAIQDFDKAILLDFKDSKAFNNRGVSYKNLGQHERAIEDFDKALSINPNYVDAYSNRGNAYVCLGQYQRAIEDFDKAISLNPNHAEAYSNRGNAYSGLGQYERAIEDLDKTISLKPGLVGAYNNRGAAYANMKQFNRAIEDFDKAISINPNYAGAYYNRGEARREMGDMESANADFVKAQELGIVVPKDLLPPKK